MQVNQSAPVFVSDEIGIAAPPEVVWRVLSDLASWPAWNPDVKSMTVEGPLVEGTTFRWKAGTKIVS